MKYKMLQVNIKNQINKGIGDEIQYSESQIYEYTDRHKFFDNSKETSFYF